MYTLVDKIYFLFFRKGREVLVSFLLFYFLSTFMFFVVLVFLVVVVVVVVVRLLLLLAPTEIAGARRIHLVQI